MARLKAPFPYFGGKSRIAPLVWSRLGDVDNYIEPFCGSAAMLLNRPTPPRIETINDADCYVANFWRATSRDPLSVVRACDWPVNEADLHAKHRWLVLSEESAHFRRQMRTDPNYFNATIAGWWCWGLCCWIGGGWCTAHGRKADGDVKEPIPEIRQDGKGVICKPHEKRSALANSRGVHRLIEQIPELSGEAGASGRGVHASAGPSQKKPQACGNGYGPGVCAKGPTLEPCDWAVEQTISEKLPALNPGGNARSTPGRGCCGLADHEWRTQLGNAYARGLGVHGDDAAGTCQRRVAWLLDWFGRLRDRLRAVRVCCGDWLRVCNSPSTTTRMGEVGVFFDPPYSLEAGRNMDLYAVESADAAHRVREYCLERGGDPLMRIALCGYEGEGHEALESAGWEVVAWKAHGGYGNRSAKGRANAARERVWFSPHCLNPAKERMLF